MNSQLNQQTNAIEEVQSMIDTNTAMYRSNRMVLANSMANRPVNTIKAYTAKQNEWKVQLCQ